MRCRLSSSPSTGPRCLCQAEQTAMRSHQRCFARHKPLCAPRPRESTDAWLCGYLLIQLCPTQEDTSFVPSSFLWCLSTIPGGISSQIHHPNDRVMRTASSPTYFELTLCFPTSLPFNLRAPWQLCTGLEKVASSHFTDGTQSQVTSRPPGWC